MSIYELYIFPDVTEALLRSAKETCDWLINLDVLLSLQSKALNLYIQYQSSLG